MESFIYLILAILGLGFLVFIHELGHYFVALHVGMRVEAFGIGFGKAIYSWKTKNGVEWRINWLPFGGYVKIAGMEKENGLEPCDIPDGFFGRPPIDRIKVAFMGPFINLLFAFIAFCFLWGVGGREKSFTEFTPRIGWVDTKSELYEQGVRPGDIITSYNDREMHSFKDHLYAAMLSDEDVKVEGLHVNYHTGEKTPFTYQTAAYPHPASSNKEILTTGVLTSASYILFPEQDASNEAPKLPEGSPMTDSGIKPGDRIVWADGEAVFSIMQLQQIINDDKALITVQRGQKIIQARIPRVRIEELRFGPDEKEEIIDWQYEARLRQSKLSKLFFFPFNLNADGTIEGRIRFIDKEVEAKVFPNNAPDILRQGDRIIAVDGKPVQRAHEVMGALQERQVHLIVQRVNGDQSLKLWTEAEKEFDSELSWNAVDNLGRTIGTENRQDSLGSLHLLKPITPKRQMDFQRTEEQQKKMSGLLAKRREAIETLSNSDERNAALEAFSRAQNTLLIGLPLQDRKVIYNPGPLPLFYSVYEETATTLQALVTGYLSPKWLAGPVGIVQVIQKQWSIGVTEALFWLASISINLGMLNLLPVPVLDGGHICMALYEMVTKRKISARAMEWLIMPFAVVLISFLVYLTYYDLGRLFSNLSG
jgi:regulator of sigma E protease